MTQQIDLNAFKSAKASDRKGLAILAYDKGCADPAGANWRGIADLLRLAIPATKAKASAAELGEASAWHDYDIPANATKKLGKSPIVTVTFACGAVIRAPAVSLPGKPVNLGRGMRIAFAFYRARIAREFGKAFAAGSDCVNIPAIVSAFCGEGLAAIDYDAAELNERTAAWRLGRFDHIALAAEAEAFPVSDDTGALTRAEFYRARYRLALGTAGKAEAEYIRLRLSGMSKLEIDAIQRAAVKAEAEARKARKARVAAYLERRAARAAPAAFDFAAEISPAELGLDGAAEASAPAADCPAEAAELGADIMPAAVETAEAEAIPPAIEPAALPVAADSLPVAPSQDTPRALPVAPSRAALFLASTSLGAPRPALPVAPSCILRVVA